VDAVGHSKPAFVTKDQFMLNKKIALLGAAAIAMVSTGANAAQVTATAEVEILAPVTLSETAGLDFGIVAAGLSAGTVTIGTGANTAGCSAGLACVGTSSRGVFSVTGADTTTVVITVDASTTLSNGTPADDMTVTLTPSVTTLAANGAPQTFYVGGVLAVAGSQTAGTYTGSYDVSADYQ
jgi:Mat/Ecp fimbriae major subunit